MLNSGSGYPEDVDDALEDSAAAYHDKHHPDGVDTFLAEQALLDLQFQETWERQMGQMRSGRGRQISHVVAQASGKSVQHLLHDIRCVADIDTLSQTQLLWNAVSRARVSAEIIVSNSRAVGYRDFSDKVARNGGVDDLVNSVRKLILIAASLRIDKVTCASMLPCLRSILMALKELVTAAESSHAASDEASEADRTLSKRLFARARGLEACLSVLQHFHPTRVRAGQQQARLETLSSLVRTVTSLPRLFASGGNSMFARTYIHTYTTRTHAHTHTHTHRSTVVMMFVQNCDEIAYEAVKQQQPAPPPHLSPSCP